MPNDLTFEPILLHLERLSIVHGLIDGVCVEKVNLAVLHALSQPAFIARMAMISIAIWGECREGLLVVQPPPRVSARLSSMWPL